MGWKVFLSTFVAFLLAEMGDKTQLVAISMTAKTNRPVIVFCGAIIGLAVVTAIGVAFGQAITKIIPVAYVHKGAAVLFIIIGVAMFFGKF
jgi:putative Ca2+/H+ antiporter (TMEM165/GDT1 family)